MPNWCDNCIKVTGKEEDLKKFKEYVKGKNTYLDFEKITSSKNNKEKFRKVWDKDKKIQERYDDFSTAWFNHGKGFQWCVKNWGTKWNIDCSEPSLRNGDLIYVFSTAWSPPLPIVIKLIKKFKTLSFEFLATETGMCFGVELEGKKGKITLLREYDIESYICPKCECWFDIEADEEETCVCEDCGFRFKKTEGNE